MTESFSSPSSSESPSFFMMSSSEFFSLTLSQLIERLHSHSPFLLSASQLPLKYLILYPIVVFTGLFLLFKFYQLLWRPFHLEKLMSPNDREAAIHRPVPEAYPSPFPNSWYKICESFDLQIGESKPLKAFGQELVIFRGKGEKNGNNRGQVFVMDAYCPHLGAHMGHGGAVVNNSLACPFHGWEFNGKNGQCEHIPYNTSQCTIPSQAKVTSWPVVEVNGAIYVWHDVDNLPPPPHCLNGPLAIDRFASMRYHGILVHDIAGHVQDFWENGSDTVHLDVIHGPFVFGSLSKLLYHQWIGDWVASPADSPTPHIVQLTLTTGLAWSTAHNELALPLQVLVHVTQIGAGVAHLLINTPFGRLLTFQTVLPVDRNVTRAVHVTYADPWVPRAVAKLLLHSLDIQLVRDLVVWNNKICLRTPMVVKNDGPILKFRRWYQQFYSKKGTKAKATPLVANDW